MRSAAVTGRVVQYRYDPFRNPDRARAEEFGDVLAEGIYWLLDQGRSIADADQAHWEKFLVKRGEFIRRVLGMVADATDLKPDEKARRIAALKGSLGRLARITPQMCEDYLQAWRADRQAWQRHLKMLPAGLERASALAHLSADGASPLNWQPRRRGSRYQHADTVGVTQLSATHPGNGDLAGIGPDAANVHAHSAERERVLAE
jgi:hypothetical protein